MDYLRSAHEAPTVFRVGDTAIPIRWYRADPAAKCFPFFHAFPSLTWKGNDYGTPDIGERLPMLWRNGQPPGNAGTGNDFAIYCANQHPDWWTQGLGTGEESGPYNEAGLPVCCVDGPPPVVPCDDCSAVPDVDLLLTFDSPGCDCLDGSTWTLSWNAFPGNWTANGIELCSDCPLPNFGALVVSRVLASEPCTLLLEGGQLFCNFDLGTNEAEAECNGEGEFLTCVFTGTIGGGGPCDGVAFTATLEVAP